MASKDIMLDANYDLDIRSGDFVVDHSEDQHMALILLNTKGGWRQSPLMGVGLINYTNSPFGALEADDLKQAIKIQLQLDGYTDPDVTITSFEEININAVR